ncbi:MAG TPA: methylmalonyl-CoA mutase family protein [bacterium]|nr:methylmalonyl-CoA mutase family protein [bacterium]
MAESPKKSFKSGSDIPVKDVYTQADAPLARAVEAVGFPGEMPFTRGVQPTMYRGRLWTMRQYAGFGTAADTNNRFKFLLQQGQTGLSTAFDLPTQMGFDSDAPRASGEVGRVGVPISTMQDMRTLLDGLPLEKVSTSMTINSTAGILLVLYAAVAMERGIDSKKLRGTIQNDILKEYAARGTYVYPPKPSMRIITDIFAWAKDAMPEWNTISISGYHIREAGSTADQEIAFTLANGAAYVKAAIDAGLKVDDFAPQLSFFFNVHNDFLEEIAKFRAARRMWAKILSGRFGAKSPKSLALKFHAQTAGATLTAQQPKNNVVRVALQCLAAVLGGAQSIHTNSLDEALALPTEETVRVALRTQQIIAEETGVANTVDPVGGSFAIEAMTDELEKRAFAYLERIDKMGGAVAAIEQGFVQREIENAAYDYQRSIEKQDRVVVGVNRFQAEKEAPLPTMKIDPALEKDQAARVKAYKAKRDAAKVEAARREVERAAKEGTNLLPRFLAAVQADVTLGEISDTLRAVFGEYRPS